MFEQYDDEEDQKADPYRKVISLRFNKKKIAFDSNDMPIAKCEKVCELFGIVRGKYMFPELGSTPREPGEKKEDYLKRVNAVEGKPAEVDDSSFRKDGESIDDWYSRIFKGYIPDQTAIKMGLPLINGAQKIIYGDDAAQLTEDEYKCANLRQMVNLCNDLLKEVGVPNAMEFDPKRIFPTQ